jgi:hypothetical protein
MKIKLTIALLALAGGIILFANSIFAADSTTNSVSQTNEPSPFQITVTARKTLVHVGESFKVSLEVKNISNTNQSFLVWSCSWWENWKSNNRFVYLPAWDCGQNAPMTVNLAPDESFRETLNGNEMPMRVVDSVSTNRISFRMAFHTGGSVHLYKADEIMPDDVKGKIYWSNEVTIDLIAN